MFGRVVFLGTDVSEDEIAFIISVTRISVLRMLVTAIVVPNSPHAGGHDPVRYQFYKSTRRHMPEDTILHSHRRDILKSYITLNGWTV
jgi:hypothetical protein